MRGVCFVCFGWVVVVLIVVGVGCFGWFGYGLGLVCRFLICMIYYIVGVW